MGEADGRRAGDLRAFGPFHFRTRTRELIRDGRAVPLPPKASLVLGRLLADPGELVSRQALYDAAWADTVVEYDQGLNACVRQIRAALGDDARDPTYVETVPRRGYRFRHPVRRVAEEESPARRARGGHWRSGAAWAASLTVAFLLGQSSASRAPASTSVSAGATGDASVAVDFVLDGTTPRMAGLDATLEAAVRRHLSRGPARQAPGDAAAAGRAPGLRLHGTVRPRAEGALLEAVLVRASDGVVLWTGSFNPLCPDVRDPVSFIGRYLASEVTRALT